MTLDSQRIGGVVLCGGRSRRIGTSKAWLRFGDECLLQRMVRIVGEVVNPVVAAGRTNQSLPPLPEAVSVVCDAIEDAGPLAGIAAGFEAFAGRCDAALVVACDYPLIVAPVLQRLIDSLADHKAVVVRDDQHLHPLLGVYRLSTRDILARQLAAGNFRAGHFAKECQTHVIEAANLIDVDRTLASLQNVNDQEAYEQALRELSE